MIQHDSHDPEAGAWLRSGPQPIALATILLLLIVVAIGSTALWRATTGRLPEVDRVALARLLHAQLADRTRGLEASQQEAIDQLQVVQDELQTVKRLLASEEADKKRLADQVAVLTEAVDGLRQSFASAPPDASPPPETRSASTMTHAINGMHYRRSKVKS